MPFPYHHQCIRPNRVNARLTSNGFSILHGIRDYYIRRGNVRITRSARSNWDVKRKAEQEFPMAGLEFTSYPVATVGDARAREESAEGADPADGAAELG